MTEANFKIIHQDGKGRIGIASKDFKPYELVLEDTAAAFGPFQDAESICVACLRDLSADEVCQRCHLPLHKDCEESERNIHGYECDIFANLPADYPRHGISGLIMPIRLLQLRTTEPKLWKQVFDLESHHKARTGFSLEHKSLLDQLGFTEEDIEALEILTGIVQTNSASFGKKRGMSLGHGLFPTFSLLSHECDSNCRYYATRETHSNQVVIQVRAKRAIIQGEELTIQYKNPLLGNVVRTTSLQRNWLFDCQCARCQDPTELGTYLSALRCRRDGCEGMVLPRDFYHISISGDPGFWYCSSCDESIDSLSVETDLKRFDKLIRATSCLESVTVWEGHLEAALSVFAPTHYLVMDITRVLIQLYGSLPGMRLKDLSSERLSRKAKMCQEYLHTYNRVDTGYSKWKGRIYEEYVGPIMILAQREMEQGKMSPIEYKLQMAKGMNLLKDAAKCRQYETGENFSIAFACLLKEINDLMTVQ